MAQFTDIQAADGAFQQLSMHGAKTKEDLVAASLYWSDQEVDQAKRVIKILISKINGETMSEQFEEYELESDIGKFPKTAFTGIFKGYQFMENSNKTKVLRLLFDEDTVVDMYGRGKLKDGRVPGNLGSYIASLAKLNIKSIAIQQNGELIALRHEPDIINCKMSIEPIIDKKIGDADQTEDSIWWGRVTQIYLDEQIQSPKPTPTPTLKPAAASKAKPAPKPAAADMETVDNAIYDLILANPLPISGIYKQFGGKAKSPYQPGDLRVSLDRMKTQGKVIQTGDNFEGV